MNSRRSRSVKLVSAARANRALEVDIAEEGEEDSRMSSSAANTVYCCIARGRSVIYRYSSSKGGDGGSGGDPQVEATAALCLDISPPHHRHFVHTAGRRSYGYLMADDHTFFAIIDPSVGSAGALQFLERVRDAFRSSGGGSASRNSSGFRHDSLVPAVQRLVASLEKMPHAAFVLEDGSDGAGDGCTTSSSSSKVPLLGKSGSRKEKRRSRDKLASAGDFEDEHHGTRAVRIDVAADDGAPGGMSLERSASQSRLRRQLQQQQPSRSLWMRHVKVIIVVDAVICLLLFAAWLAVCKGFQCVSG